MGLRRFVSRLIGGDDSRDGSPTVPKTTALITRSFKATVADELSVSKGSLVRAMYREDDWIYVECDGKRGFVPAQYCAIRRREDGREARRVASSLRSSSDWNKSNLQRFLDSLPVKKEDGSPFRLATSPGDLTITANEKVIVLNADDPQWTFVEDGTRAKGFVPASFVNWDDGQCGPRHTDRFVEQTLLVAEDYNGRCPLDITVHAGSEVIGIFDEEEPFLWVRKGDREGFVPTRCVVLATNL